ncbi:MAG: LytR C-terminal domain-containing protein [Wujia sp.]
MKKQSVAGLFFSMFLRAAVVILGLAIIVFGIVILMKVVKGDKGSDSPATTVGDNVLTETDGRDDLIYNTTAEESADSEQTQDGAVAASYDKQILVLNSTGIAGVAGGWCTKLNEAGYNYTVAADYTTPLETTRIVSKEDGVGQDLVGFFNGATYEVGEVTEGSMEDTTNYDIVIIIGASDSGQ